MLVTKQVLSCVYTSAKKSTQFQLITLIRVPLYSQITLMQKINL